MTAETIVFFITCATAFISFITITVKLTQYITKAEAKIDSVAAEVKSAEAEHKDIWGSVDKNSKDIQRHEIWIAKHDAREDVKGDDGK